MENEAAEVKREQRDPEREARRRVALAQIRQYGDPVLRMRAREVESFDGDLEQLVERMKALMQDANGVGLAANQVGVLQRVLVMHPNEEGPIALVNPVLARRLGRARDRRRGLPLAPGRHRARRAAVRIAVDALDESGNEIELELEGLPARILQHEVDHLDGVLILERTTDDSRREALAVLRPRITIAPS